LLEDQQIFLLVTNLHMEVTRISTTVGKVVIPVVISSLNMVDNNITEAISKTTRTTRSRSWRESSCRESSGSSRAAVLLCRQVTRCLWRLCPNHLFRFMHNIRTCSAVGKLFCHMFNIPCLLQLRTGQRCRNAIHLFKFS
jgi:hypothetical protein